jgi:hypothetical protein
LQSGGALIHRVAEARIEGAGFGGRVHGQRKRRVWAVPKCEPPKQGTVEVKTAFIALS